MVRPIALALAATGVAAGALVLWAMRGDAPAPPVVAAPASVHSPTVPAQPVTRLPASAAPANPLARSADLRAIYEQYKDSALASERNLAYHAWSACFPTFLGPEGQMATLESVTRALPPEASARSEAYRALMGRCKGFSNLGRAQLLAETARQSSNAGNGSALAAGELANKYLLDGRLDQAVQTARAALATRDPLAVDSLREFMNQYLSSQIDAQQLPRSERVDLRALGFSLAACQLGMECGPDTLTALQLCANSGACSGGVVERYLEPLSEPERARAREEGARVVQAVNSGNPKALGL